MVDLQIDGTMIILFTIVGLVIIGGLAFAFDEVGDFIDGIIYDPNRQVDSYEVVCEFTIENPVLIDLRFDKTRGVQCYSRKPRLFSLESSRILSLVDDGLVRMAIDGNERYRSISVGEGGRNTYEMIVKKVSPGTHTLTLSILDEEYKPISPVVGDSIYTMDMFVGG